LKKWWWHTISCVCNGIAVTAITILFITDMVTNSYSFSGAEVLGLIIFFLGYGIYIISDIWGLRLYSRYKNPGSVSFAGRDKTQVLLVFLFLLQLIVGYGVISAISRYSRYFNFEEIGIMGVVTDILTTIIFFTLIFVFIGLILLIRSIKRNKILFKEEIESIGRS